MNTVRAPGQPWGSCTRLGGPTGRLLTPPMDRGRWAQWGLLLCWGWSLSFRPCPPHRAQASHSRASERSQPGPRHDLPRSPGVGERLPIPLLTCCVPSARRCHGQAGSVLGPGCGPHRRRHPGGWACSCPGARGGGAGAPCWPLHPAVLGPGCGCWAVVLVPMLTGIWGLVLSNPP